jgi:hypothetical protein
METTRTITIDTPLFMFNGPELSLDGSFIGSEDPVMVIQDFDSVEALAAHLITVATDYQIGGAVALNSGGEKACFRSTNRSRFSQTDNARYISP